jgi:hypothetical protein
MTPDPTEPEPAEAEAVEATEADATDGEATEEVFQNRAARRAHSKGRRQPPPDGKGHISAGRGSVQGPRQWGNRRSG